MGRKRRDDGGVRDNEGGAKLSARQQEIRHLQAKGRTGRSEEESAQLSVLLSEERRERWTRLHDKRVLRFKAAVRSLTQMSNPASYQYDADEAARIVKLAQDGADKIKSAFVGTVKEKGLFDL